MHEQPLLSSAEREKWLYVHFLVAWPWTIYITSLCLNFPFYKIGKTVYLPMVAERIKLLNTSKDLRARHIVSAQQICGLIMFLIIIINICTVPQTDHLERINGQKPGSWHSPGPFLIYQTLMPVKKTQKLESAFFVGFTRALEPFAAPTLSIHFHVPCY